MKLKKLLYSIPLAVILLAVGTGCRKSQFNINRNVNDPTDSSVTYDVVLPAALHASGGIVANQWGTIQNWLGFWARSGTYAPNVIEETYQITTTFGNGIWNGCYDNNYDYNIVQVKARAAEAGFYEGIARIMKAQNFQILVDVYGNVPYSQALKGSGNPTPGYDDGLVIYQDLFRQIDTGIYLIKNAIVTATSPNKDIWKNDIMFGDPNASGIAATSTYVGVATQKMRWVQLGNSLKLRLLMHTYAVGAINKTAELQRLYDSTGVFLGAANLGSDALWLTIDAQVQPGYKSDKPMPFHANYKTTAAGGVPANNVYYAANKWGIDMYKGNGDPRQTRLYEAGSGGLIGVLYGAPPVGTAARSILAGIGPGAYKTNSSPQIFFSAAEAWFLRTEARHRNFITVGDNAQTLLTKGVIASMEYLGVANAATAANTYITGNASYPDVDYSTGVAQCTGCPTGGLATILSQKWFALNSVNPLEVWTDYRRVPYTEVATKPGANTKHFVYGEPGGYAPGPFISVAPQNTATEIPIRYLYPQTEYNYNSANVGAQGAINQFTSRVFWDVN